MTTQLLTRDSSQVFYGVSWEKFEEIEQSFEDVVGVRFAYLDGTLEIMTIGDEHEFIKKTIGLLLEAYMRAKDIRFYARGGPSLGNREQGARREPDESYNLSTRKPIPDFLVEVVVTSGGVDKLTCYQRIQVPEVWFWEDGKLTLYCLRGDGYEKINRSEFLPDLDLVLLSRYITYYDQYDAVTEFLSASNSQ